LYTNGLKWISYNGYYHGDPAFFQLLLKGMAITVSVLDLLSISPV
jgi:hypothetical protein